jgi:hypothetical protein
MTIANRTRVNAVGSLATFDNFNRSNKDKTNE